MERGPHSTQMWIRLSYPGGLVFYSRAIGIFMKRCECSIFSSPTKHLSKPQMVKILETLPHPSSKIRFSFEYGRQMSPAYCGFIGALLANFGRKGPCHANSSASGKLTIFRKICQFSAQCKKAPSFQASNPPGAIHTQFHQNCVGATKNALFECLCQ